MEFSIKSGSPEKQRTDCVVVGIHEGRKLTLAAEMIDRVSDGYLSDILRRGDMEGKVGSTLLLHNVRNTLSERVLLVGLGKEREFKDKPYRSAVLAAMRVLNQIGALDASLYLTELAVRRRDVDWTVEQAVLLVHESQYRFDGFKSKTEEVRRPLKRMTLAVPRRTDLATGEEALRVGLALARAIDLAKDLGNRAGNHCTPAFLADTARNIAQAGGLSCTVLEQAELEALGMGSFLSVARGSVQPPKFIVLEHRGLPEGSKRPPVVLVGKGVTFDSGGISLKPGEGMDEMKYDMSGAGSVLATMQAVAELQVPLHIVALIPATENMPGGAATKPGDIVTTLSGQTVEVLNTDAEGRLILCDALTYAKRYEPEVVVDVATLTGACVIALGHVASGLYANQDSLARELVTVGDDTGDRVWHMPLWDDYQEQLKSNFADLANIGGRPAGSVTAACFLSRFTDDYPWAHLDIAGTAWRSGKDKGSTGRPVPLLLHFLLGRARQ